jgi:acyl-CoA dehydrogenase
LSIAISAVASMERALDLTLVYVKNRTISGQPLFGLQNTRFRLAEAKTHAVVGRVFVDHCISNAIDGELDPDVAAMAKWYLTDLQGVVVDNCLQLFGGSGYCLDQPIARMYRDARVQRIFGGSNEVMKDLISHTL